MRGRLTALARAAAAGALASAIGLAAGSALAKDQIVIGIPTFLTGAGAPAFGVPARNGAELMIQAINAGTLPAPYDSKGFAGAEVVAEIYDESGGNTKQVTEFRNKVQKQNIEAFVGFVSSGTCQAITPVAEELKVLTIFAVCGTPRVFEELDPDPKYVFRSMSHATTDGVAAAHYLKAKFPQIKSYGGINQNYAWGQDSWRDFDLSMKQVMASTTASDKLQWPKIFAGQYGAEVSALLLGKDDIVHTSFWGGDLEAFIFQGSARGLFQRKTVLFTVAGTAVYRLGKKMPQGAILGARGPYGIFAENIDTPMNKWFWNAYVDRFGTKPTGPSYQYAQGVLVAKYGYDKAMKMNGGQFPSTEQVIEAIAGSDIPSISTTVHMSRAKGHQAMTNHMYGITGWDSDNGQPIVTDVVEFGPECVMPPDGVTGVDWINGGMKGAKC